MTGTVVAVIGLLVIGWLWLCGVNVVGWAFKVHRRGKTLDRRGGGA